MSKHITEYKEGEGMETGCGVLLELPLAKKQKNHEFKIHKHMLGGGSCSILCVITGCGG